MPGETSLSECLIEVWRQAMADRVTEVILQGHHYKVGETRAQGLRTVAFVCRDQVIDGIEQNPQTKSNWAKLATEGKRIMQYRCKGRYIGNVCEGKLTRYPSWKALGLPD